MELGLIGIGKMGANMASRLARAGHAVVVMDRDPAAVASLTVSFLPAIRSLPAETPTTKTQSGDPKQPPSKGS